MKDPVIERVKLSEIRPNPSNPRELSREKFDELVKSIKDFPKMLSAEPIKIANGVILSGNQRYQALKRLGHKEAYVQRLDHFTEEERLEYIIKANVHSGIWDWDILANGNEWEEYKLKEWGLDVWQPDEAIIQGLTDPDEVPEIPVEPETKLGDLYILGGHRVLCGDSTKAEDLGKLMNGEKADMVFTDPPYGMGLDTDYTKMSATSLKHSSVIGDDKQFNGAFILSVFNYCDEIFLWGGDYYLETLSRKYPNLGSWVVWDKRSNDENIGLLDGAFGSDFELCWSKTKHKREIARILRQTGHFEARSEDKRLHPTQKPIALAEWFFDRWGKNTKVVADPFLGSGSTLIAAEKTNRKCYGMELDPKYCDVIVKRWEDFTGKKAVKQ